MRPGHKKERVCTGGRFGMPPKPKSRAPAAAAAAVAAAGGGAAAEGAALASGGASTSAVAAARPWKAIATVRKINDTTGEFSRIQLEYRGDQLRLTRQRKRSGASETVEVFPFSSITHLIFGPTVMARIFQQYPLLEIDCDPWCCLSFRTKADITYDIVANDGRAAREGANPRLPPKNTGTDTPPAPADARASLTLIA